MLTWERPGILRHLIAMCAQGIFYFTLLILIEFNVPQRLYLSLTQGSSGTAKQSVSFPVGSGLQEDADVAEERRRINSTPLSVLRQENSLLLVNLSKQYRRLKAVKQVCVGIATRECFGLLGQNGAGKTTVFKMLTGVVIPSGGNAYLLGLDIKTNIKKVIVTYLVFKYTVNHYDCLKAERSLLTHK